MKTIRKIRNLFFANVDDKMLTNRLKSLLGFTPANLSIFRLAFKHSSRSPEAHTSNERLEYLGDAILDAIISDFLFKKYPLRGEGFLTEMRSKIVKRKKLGEIGERLFLESFLDYNKSYVTINDTILGNAFEALVGAIYLDAGYEKTKIFIFDKILTPYFNLDLLQKADINYKSRLFEWSQKHLKNLNFDVIKEKMDGNYRIFVVEAYIDGEKVGEGEGRSKKEAQKAAAKEAYDELKVGEEMEE